MEHTDEIKKSKDDKKNLVISVAFIIAIFLFCFLLIVAIVVLIRNVKEIRTDPILYGMEKRGYDICSCVQEDGMRIDYTIGVPELFYLNEERVTDGAG